MFTFYQLRNCLSLWFLLLKRLLFKNSFSMPKNLFNFASCCHKDVCWLSLRLFLYREGTYLNNEKNFLFGCFKELFFINFDHFFLFVICVRLSEKRPNKWWKGKFDFLVTGLFWSSTSESWLQRKENNKIWNAPTLTGKKI